MRKRAVPKKNSLYAQTILGNEKLSPGTGKYSSAPKKNLLSVISVISGKKRGRCVQTFKHQRKTGQPKNRGQVFYAYTISVNVGEEIGGEVNGCRLPGGGYYNQSAIRCDRRLRLDKTLKI
jgi:hypothetical protein